MTKDITDAVDGVKEEKPKRRKRTAKVKEETQESVGVVKEVTKEEVPNDIAFRVSEDDESFVDEDGVTIKVSKYRTLADNFEDEGIEWDIKSYDIPPFEYGYRTVQMNEENLPDDATKYRLNRKVRTSDMTLQFIPGSMRSIFEAMSAYPNPYFNMREEEAVKAGYDTINPQRSYWKAMSWLALGTSNPAYDYYRHMMNDSSVRWRNGWELPSGKLRGIRSKPNNFEGAKTSENNAMMLLNSVLNIGKDVDIFLPHSGFSVVIKAPILSQFIELERKIIGDRLDIFRNTRGLFMSHDMSVVHQAIFDLFVSCVVSTSVGVTDREFLLENISILDINDIAWALACAKYPNGYVAVLPCFAQPSQCNTVVNEVIDPRKLYFTNHARLSEFQKSIAAKISGTVTQEDIDKYIDDFDYGEEKYCEIRAYDTELKIRIYFLVPSIGEMVRSAEAMRLSLENSANNAFAHPLVGDERSQYLREQFDALGVLKYEPWVSEIAIVNEDGEETRIDSQASIRSVLMGISTNPLQVMDFKIGVEKFINRATVSVVGIPNMACPGCGGFHETDYPNGAGRHLIPLDVITFFMILCQQLTQNSLSKTEGMVSEMMIEEDLSKEDIS